MTVSKSETIIPYLASNRADGLIGLRCFEG